MAAGRLISSDVGRNTGHPAIPAQSRPPTGEIGPRRSSSRVTDPIVSGSRRRPPRPVFRPPSIGPGREGSTSLHDQMEVPPSFRMGSALSGRLPASALAPARCAWDREGLPIIVFGGDLAERCAMPGFESSAVTTLSSRRPFILRTERLPFVKSRHAVNMSSLGIYPL